MAFSGGEIRPRTPHQAVTIRSQQTDKRLAWQSRRQEWDDGSDERRVVGVQNLLGTNVLYAVAKTQTGLYEVKDLAADEQKSVVKIDQKMLNSKPCLAGRFYC